MTIMLDTNWYIGFCRAIGEIAIAIKRADKILLPFVVLAELRAGFHNSKAGYHNEMVLMRFISSPRVNIIYPDNDTTHQYAALFTQLRKQGTPIPTNDIWIAALALQNNAILCSNDRHFANLPQLAIWQGGT